MRRHTGPSDKLLPGGLAIIHEDRDIIVVDKPPGLLTISTDREKSRTAYFILTDYVRKGFSKPRNRIFIVYRLDRETSGILLFAKNEAAKFCLQSQWQHTKKRKGVFTSYCLPSRCSDTVKSWDAPDLDRSAS